ncbi:MAG: helix-turn-helix domain-containing protein [Methanobrevibacter sp.]|nr:helix-turn-helix domain-containing protein [Methanobrevibacter sp.]
MLFLKENNKDIGNRIKELREILNISIEELTNKLEIPKEKYIAYENGERDIPASILYEIAQKFNVDMGLLITGEETRMRIFTITRKGEGSSVDRRKQYDYENLSSKFIHKKAEPFVVTVDPLNYNDKPNQSTHLGQEFNYILEGSLMVCINNNEIVLNEGDSIFFDSSYPHYMKSLNNKIAKFLAIIL